MLLVGFEVLTAVVMKSSIFWDITQCNPFKVNRSFRKNISPIFGVEEKANQETSVLATCFHVSFFLGLIFDPEDGGDMFLRNVS
jgi:hypothetical protein